MPFLRSCLVPLKYIEYGVYGDLIMILMYPKPYSICLGETIHLYMPTNPKS